MSTPFPSVSRITPETNMSLLLKLVLLTLRTLQLPMA
jgi:hypothetical protein